MDPITPRLLTPEQAAAYLNIPADTLSKWRYLGGKGPAFVRVNKAHPVTGYISPRNVIRYPLDKLNEWIEANLEGAA
jgi:hypothetical protein